MGHIKCDLEKCAGCLACVVACIDRKYNETEVDAVSGRIYEAKKSDRSDLVCYKTRSCHHCADPECVKACPTDALYQKDGYVLVKKENCIGCKKCEKACPFDIPRFDKNGKIVKCDGCYERIIQGKEPACVRVCPLEALSVVK